MSYTTNSAVAICIGIAMACLVGCAPTTHVTETTTTKEYDTTNPPVMEPAPVTNSGTTTTTQFDNGTMQRTYNTQPAPYTPPDQSTTTVTTDTNNGTVQKQTTTTYPTP
jgi:hypothetical protein